MTKTQILVVEDEGIVALNIQSDLERLGYDVPVVVASGEEAVQETEKVRPDLVLMDIMLAGDMDGVEAGEQIRARFNIPVVYLTAHADDKTLQRAKITEPFGYVLKPFDERELHTTIEIALYKHKAEEALRRRDAILEAVSFAAEQFLKTASWQENIQAVLERLGQATEVSRVYILNVDRDNYTGEDGTLLTSLCHEWVGPGITPQIDNPELQAFSLRARGFARWEETLGQGQIIHGHVRGLPASERENLALQGVRSMVAVPIFVGEAWWGFIGFDQCKTEREWSVAEIDALKAAAGTLGAAIQRTRLHQEVQQMMEELEAEVAARTAEIRAEKEKSEAILRSVGDAIAMTDLEMQIQYVNDAFTTLTGYTAEEATGQLARFLAGEAMPDPVRQSLWLALEKGEVWQGEVTGRRKDGRTYEAAMTIAPVCDAEGHLAGYVSSRRDISRLKELGRARSRFMDSVSDQLRTPITTIKLRAALIRQKPEESMEHLGALENEAAWLSRLAQDILEMTSLDSGQAVTAWESISLPVLIEGTVARYQSRAEAAGLTLLATPIPPDLPAVKGDEARLGQALGELVENAVIFSPTGGQATVEVGTAEEGGQRWVTIAVSDTGPGISAEEQTLVFDRFYRGSPAQSGHIPGTGLGLSMVQQIMRAHGGQVTVESDADRGSTFTLWLRPELSRTVAERPH